MTRPSCTSLVPRPFPRPAFHRFQYQIRRGKVWEIWSRVMTSGRQMVDTRGAVPNRYNTCFMLIRPWRCEQLTVPIVCLTNALISSHWMDSTTQDVENLRWAPPSVCLQCVYLMASHVTRSPRPSPAVFHTGNTGSGNGLGTRLLLYCARVWHTRPPWPHCNT